MKSEPGAHPLEQISAFSDGELSSEESVQVQEHLRSCPDCRQVLHDIRRMSAAVGEEAVAAAPAGLAASIRRRIESGSEARAIRPRVSFWKSPFPLATAAALILVTVAYLGWRHELPQRSAADLDVSTSSPPPEAAPVGTEENKKADLQPSAPPDAGAAGGFVAYDKEGTRRQELDERMKRQDEPARDEKVEIADSLDYADGAGAKAKTAPRPGMVAAPTAPLSKQSAAAAEASPQRSALRAGKDAAADDETVTGAAEGAQLAAPDEGAAVGEARSLVYEGPDLSATFAEDGLITVITRGYACSVSVDALSPPPPAGKPGPKAVDDLPSLFAAAVSKEFLAAPSRPADMVASQEAARENLLSSLTLRNGNGDPLHSVAFGEPLQEGVPEIVRTMRQGMQRLFSVRYRAELEKRCGPLPPLLAPAR
ncbi:MAG TPA: zf-HC2 domain-containing protein [Candidatus Polarisedimenticolia bacterium]|nr:zf-HC2 domain-containing protein [Candidatus Polarisedimenticolia bacterium]